MIKATELDYAWAAGFFDGEGCVSISDCTKKTSGRGMARHITMKILVCQKDKRPLDKFQSLFGGEVKLFARRGGSTARGGFCDMWEIVLRATLAADALRRMLPYLILKGDIAKVALELQARIDGYPRKGRGCPLTDEEVAIRRELLAKAKWLNRGRWAAAETKPSGLMETSGSDSPNCMDSKHAESAEMPDRVQ